MKIIKSLDEFNINETEATPQKSKFNFSITGSLKKTAKIQKTLIDIHQLLTEMSDEIVVLKINYSNLDPDTSKILDWMKGNIDSMLDSLQFPRVPDKSTAAKGMIADSGKLQRNLERLKKGFLQKKGA